MPANDPVPCFYTGQNYRWEKPAKVLPRSEVRKLKSWGEGKFIENGKIFLFAKSIVVAIAEKVWDGPLGVGNLLPFAKAHNYGDKLHYEMPMAGDRTAYARSFRKELHPSSRALFNQPGIQWASYLRRVTA
jgi:hypothetical protein